MNSDIRGLTVLVVDDMATNRQVLQIFLTKQGCQVLTANDGQQAVDICRSGQPDLVLMDVMMPIMDGHEATRRIKAEHTGRWLPIVFLSALDKEEDLVAGLEAGGDDYLAKPINLVVLNAKLRSLARTIRAQRSLDEARQWNQAVSDSIDDCIITIDESSIIQSVNKAVTRLFGYEAHELIGANVNILMPALVGQRHDGYIANYLGRPEPNLVGNGHRQVEGLTRDGRTFMLEAGITEMHQQGRRLFVGILRDITARIAAEETLRQHAAELQHYHDDREAESALAGEILARLLQRPGLADPRIAYWLEAATYFSGDIVAACVSPEGKLYALLADGTGHGLAAAISQLPVLAAFYGLAEHDYALGFIAYQVNRQLLSFMPTGRFVAATMLCLDPDGRRAVVWTGGMPELLRVAADGTVSSGLTRTNLPLGIAEFDEEAAQVSVIDCPPGSQLVMVSDGLTDALSPTGDAFGKERLISTLAGTPAAGRVPAVRKAVTEHSAAASATDDISIMVIDCQSRAL
jgi:PAS domain S-box-containing protein